MKKYFIGSLLVIILLLSSIIYKLNYKLTHDRVLKNYPITKKNVPFKKNDTPKLFLYIVFTKNNCHDCLRVIDVLNTLSEPYSVIGLVSKKDLENEMELREATGAEFKLIAYNKEFKKFNNNYAPTIYGVGQNGNIYFVLPGVPNEKEYFKKFLDSFYSKAYSLLGGTSN